MPALVTLFTPPSWCANRYAVFVDDHAPGTSIIPPSSGWIDPSFTRCIPTQYTTAYPTFSPGICPVQMSIVKSAFKTHGRKTIWTAACCQSGFSPMSINPEYLCTSAITSPMAFLLDPNVSTTDIYTTLPPELWIEHDQVTVQWEKSDLELFPVDVASQYARIMGITTPPSTNSVATEITSMLVTPVATSTTSLPLVTTTPGPQPPSQRSSSLHLTSESQLQATSTENGASLKDLGSFTFILVSVLMALAA
ncbi:hypothetical protein HD806DRAFT_534376 [Xylariaceae sp. AK1471]|nr:hypothetical protein HD806DRAFT_534376 [Xylariaceae sp. AK1471]